MNTTSRRCAVVVLLLLSAACESSRPPSPTGPSQPPVLLPSPTPPTTKSFPPSTGPSRTFIFDRELSYRASQYTKQSRFLLYDNGAFVLQYVGLAGEYRGGYMEANGVMTFEWEGWSAAGEWRATGTVNGDSLTVQYNLVMRLTDFEDAVYVLTR